MTNGSRQLRLRAEYGAWAVWDVTGPVSENLDPFDLGISDTLAEALETWAKVFDRTMDDEYPPWSGFASASERAGFVSEGHRLAQSLGDALPHCEVALDLGDGPLPLASEQRARSRLP